MNNEWLPRLAYGLSFTGLAMWAALIALTVLFGVAMPFPVSAIWVVAAALPAMGIAMLFLVATINRDEEDLS